MREARLDIVVRRQALNVVLDEFRYVTTTTRSAAFSQFFDWRQVRCSSARRRAFKTSSRPNALAATDGGSRLLRLARLPYFIQAANSASAASSESLRAAARTLDGTQSGKGISLVT
jgi:hypothetical protein